MKVKVISLPYIFNVLYVLCFTRPRYQVSVYRTIGPLVCSSNSNRYIISSAYNIPVDPASVRASSRPCVHKHFQTRISPQPVPIVTKFYLKHHWGGGLIALGFGPGRIGTLVSMATNSSHRVIMGKMLCPL